MVRYLVQGRLQRRNDLLELTADKLTVETGDKVRIQLRMLDAELQPAVSSEQPIYLRDQTNAAEKPETGSSNRSDRLKTKGACPGTGIASGRAERSSWMSSRLEPRIVTFP